MNESWGSSPGTRGDLRIFDPALVAWATLRDRVIADAAALPSALDELSARAAASLKVSGAGIVVAANSGRRVVVGACDNRVPRLTMLQDTFDEGPAVDAAICAWTAALWHHDGTTRCQVLGIEEVEHSGNELRATIIAPARDSQRPAPVASQQHAIAATTVELSISVRTDARGHR